MVEFVDLQRLDASENDSEMKELIQAETNELEDSLENVTFQMKVLMLPIEARDNKQVFVQIRSLNASGHPCMILSHIYQIFSVHKKLRYEFVFKPLIYPSYENVYVTFTVIGTGAYKSFKFESGVHRFIYNEQKIEDIEVLVLNPEEINTLQVNDVDIRTEFFSTDGVVAGVRLTHIPTGLVAESFNQRSRLQNRIHAMKTLVLQIRMYHLSKMRQYDVQETVRVYNWTQTTAVDLRLSNKTFYLHSLRENGLGEIVHLLQMQEYKRLFDKYGL